jgi:hypothetical protein
MGGKARLKPNAGASGIRTRHISSIEHRRTPLLDAIFSGLLMLCADRVPILFMHLVVR